MESDPSKASRHPGLDPGSTNTVLVRFSQTCVHGSRIKSGMTVFRVDQPPSAAATWRAIAMTDRKSVVEGKRVSVRVALGGSLVLKKEDTSKHKYKLLTT